MASTFLESLSDEDRRALLAGTRERLFAAGEVLFRHGEGGDAFAVVLEGRVKLVTRMASGRSVLLGVRGRGDLLGEGAVLGRTGRSADVVAVERVRCAFGSADALRATLCERPGALFALCEALNARLREADESRVEMATLSADGRVAARVLALCEQYGERNGPGIRVTVPLTQTEIADWIGLSRPAVARALAAFRDSGDMITGRQSLVVLRPDALRRRAEF